MEYYSVIKKSGTMPFAGTWMDLEIITLNEVNQTKINIIHITYMWNLKHNTNEYKHKRETHRHTGQTCGGRGGGRGMGWELRVHRYQLAFME